MTILAFLQNQWFRDPEAARKVFARQPDRRNDLIALYLFMGCLTGKRLQRVFGEKLCDEIIWEECSPEVGGQSSSAFPADLAHIKLAIESNQPDVILAFGKIAETALRAINPSAKVIYACHPAARYGAITTLIAAHLELQKYMRATKESA